MVDCVSKYYLLKNLSKTIFKLINKNLKEIIKLKTKSLFVHNLNVEKQ